MYPLIDTVALRHFHLRARDGDVGKLKDVYVHVTSWTVAYIIVHCGTWLSGRNIAIAPPIDCAIDLDDDLIVTAMTMSQIVTSVRDDVSPALVDFDGSAAGTANPLETLITGGATVGPAPAGGESGARPRDGDRSDGGSRIHSSVDLRGFKLLDGAGDDIGHVVALSIDTAKWVVRYVITSNGDIINTKYFAIPVDSVARSDANKRTFFTDLLKETVEDAPLFDCLASISAARAAAISSYFSAGHDR